MTKNKRGKATRENLSIFETELKFRRIPFASLPPTVEWRRHCGVFCVIVEASESMCCSHGPADSLIDSFASSSSLLSPDLLENMAQKKYFTMNFLKLFIALLDCFPSSNSTSKRDKGITPYMSTESICVKLLRWLECCWKYVTSSSSVSESEDESS